MAGKRKKLLLVLGSGLLFLAAISVIVATVEISSPRLKELLSQKIQEASGIPVTAGALSIRLTGGLRARDLTLGHPGEEIFTAKGIVLECNFFEMLRRSFTVNNLVIDSPVVTVSAEDGLALPFILPAHGEDDDTGIRFQLSRVQVISGQVRSREIRPGDGTGIILDKLSFTASSPGRNEPVEIRAEATALEAISVSASGTVVPGEDIRLDFSSKIGIDWENIGPPAERFFPGIRGLGGKGRTFFSLEAAGAPDALKLSFSGDATDQEIAFGGVFSKPQSMKTLINGSAVLSPGAFSLEKAELAVGQSSFSMEGVFFQGGTQLKASSDLKAEEVSRLFPSLRGMEFGGEAALSFELAAGSGDPAGAVGSCTIQNWKFNYFAGDSLDFDFALQGKQFYLKNIKGEIGEGSLTGQGMILPGGEYHFSIEGVDIDLEKFLNIKKDGAEPFAMTGKASMAAGVRGRAESIGRLSGGGNFSATGGLIHALPWIESYLEIINLPELMPFKYREINTVFSITDGVLEARGRINGESAVITAEKATLNFLKDEKNIQADFLLPPPVAQRLRQKFREFDRFFYVDGSGQAHMSVIWDGAIAETRPNIGASLLRTGMKRLLAR